MEGYASEHRLPDDWEIRVRVLGVLIGVLLLRQTIDRNVPTYRQCLAVGVERLAA
jgi:hypothetical protein